MNGSLPCNDKPPSVAAVGDPLAESWLIILKTELLSDAARANQLLHNCRLLIGPDPCLYWILSFAILAPFFDERGLSFGYQCETFPSLERLETWRGDASFAVQHRNKEAGKLGRAADYRRINTLTSRRICEPGATDFSLRTLLREAGCLTMKQ